LSAKHGKPPAGVLFAQSTAKQEYIMAETWNKRERERNKQQKKKEKLEKRRERKHNNDGHHDLNDMLAYVDENGNLSSKPPDRPLSNLLS
jgi:ribosomal protein RSM22 (predicted rRNA methylase)